MASSRSSGIAAVAALALVVGLAAAVRGPAPMHPSALFGVWEHRDSTQFIRFVLWPGGALWGRDPGGERNGFEGMSQRVRGLSTVDDRWLSIRWYRWSSETERYILAPPEHMRWSAGGNGTLLLISPEHALHMRRRPMGPVPHRFSVSPSSCSFGGCESLSIEIDAQGRVEYDWEIFFGDVDSTRSPLGRHTSADGAELFLALTRVAALSRPDSIVYRCRMTDSGTDGVTIDYESGDRVSQSASGPCGAYDFFSSEVYRLLPTLALKPTTRPHRFATDSDEER